MSPERLAAMTVLEEAIDALTGVVDSEDTDPFGGVRNAWTIVLSRISFEDDGSTATGLRVMMPESLSDWQQIGLLRSGLLLVEDGMTGRDVA